jgi:hypothetical protein
MPLQNIFSFNPTLYFLYILMHECLVIVEVKHNSFREGYNAVMCFRFVTVLCGNQ